MTKDIERKAFEATQNTKVLFERIEYIGSMDAYMPKHEFANNLMVMQSAERFNFGWSMWKSATERAEKKLEGCVVVPDSEYNEIAQYKDLYKRAIVNARKRKNQINCAHVAGLGVGSGRAVELCKELKIDPHATDMNAMLEAARGGNE